MQAVGNLNADCYWCYNVPVGLEKPEEHDPMQLKTQWIRAKYEKQEYVRKAQVPGMPDANAPVNPGIAAYETEGYLLKEGKASGIVKFINFASNFKFMRSWKLW